MIVRPIVPGEYQRARDIWDIAYASARSPLDTQTSDEPSPEEYNNIRAAFNDDDTMIALLALYPFTVWYDGQVVDMTGIGGVATLPEYRRQGSVREMFGSCLQEMYESGVVMSTLYPFSHAYYRQFGYEVCCLRNRLSVRLDAFVDFRSEDTARQWMPGNDDKPLREVYDAFVRDTNLAVRRDDQHWKGLLEGDPYVRRRYTYLWYDTQGEPASYAILRVEDGSDGRHLHLDDFAFREPAAIWGLLTLLRSMGAVYKRLIWLMPPWIDSNTLFPEPFDTEQRIEVSGMARIVNVGEALRLLRHPERPGRYTLRVRDPLLPQNDGVWKVEFGGGEVRADKQSLGEADWTLDIRAFTQLVIGYHDVDTLMWSWLMVATPSNGDTFRRVFQRRRIYLADYF